ncbi:NUDIX domain-containing protein [Streptomyces sp. NPDC047046]|uniref:NUDIX domain-containing protein n=1 Tax=Streptomyces sp. NPDC047046 TaxID=3155378 RepID=UPI0033E514A3
MPSERTPRQAARVVVVAPDWSTYLFRYDNPEVGVHWSPPGGGLEAGETPLAGALRELAEETGWTDLRPVGELCRWEHDFTRAGIRVRQYEHVFLAHGPYRPLGPDVAAAHAADRIEDGRWWPLPELTATKEALWPPRLPDLLTLARTGLPQRPVELGRVAADEGAGGPGAQRP